MKGSKSSQETRDELDAVLFKALDRGEEDACFLISTISLALEDDDSAAKLKTLLLEKWKV